MFWKKKSDPDQEQNLTSWEREELSPETDSGMTKLHEGLVIEDEDKDGASAGLLMDEDENDSEYPLRVAKGAIEFDEVYGQKDDEVDLQAIESEELDETHDEDEQIYMDATEYIDTGKVEGELRHSDSGEELNDHFVDGGEEVTFPSPVPLKKSLTGKIFGCLGNVLFLAFILFMITVVSINAISFVKNEEPGFMGYKMYIIGEDSMNPTVKRNDAIVVKEVDQGNIKVGDLVTYKSRTGRSIITGWVTKVMEDNRFEVKKKMNSDQAVIIDGLAITGVASLRIANMGDFLEFISHPIGIGVVLVLGIIIYLLMWLLNRRREALE